VVLYSATGLDYWYDSVLTAFEANCHVRVVYQSATSIQTAQELENEQSSPYADVVVAAAPDLAKADAAGLLVAGGTPGSSGVPASRCGAGRNWCDVVENFASLVYNPRLVHTPPRTFQDLLAPRFAGRLLLSDLNLADDGRALLDLLDVTLGRDAALQYVAALERSVRSHWISTDTMSRLVSSGESLVANGNLREHLNDIPQYSNLAVWFPQIGVGPTTIAVPYGAALVRGGHNRANAVALLAAMWSKAGQAAVAAAPGLPARSDVVPTDCRTQTIRRHLAGVRIIRPDWAAIARDHAALDAAWMHLKHAPYGRPPPPAPIPPLMRC
jgi:2-aminoethylphosphonate transport system substrate-binding protein